MGKEYTVYCHELKQDGRKYFGITRQKLKDRWINGKGYPQYQYIRHAIDKYGWDAFDHIIIAEHLTEAEACQMEQDLIQQYNTMDRSKGFNMCAGGRLPNYNSICKKISKYTLNGDYIKTYPSILEASAAEGTVSQGLYYALIGKKNTSCGFQWRYGDNKENIGRVSDHICKKPVAQYDLNGNFITCYASLTEAEKATNISTGQISRACRHKIDLIGNYKWEYYYDYTG